MLNTKRTNTKTSTKFYDEIIVNDWNLRFEYEAENGEITSKGIVVTGNKGNTSLYISKANSQVQTIFSNGEYDGEVVTAIVAEFAVITAEHTLAPVE